MPHSLPPQPLPIVQPSNQTPAAVPVIEQLAVETSKPNTADLSLPARLKAAKSPTSLPARLKAAKSAVSLGAPISVGYPLKIEANNRMFGEEIAQTSPPVAPQLEMPPAPSENIPTAPQGQNQPPAPSTPSNLATPSNTVVELNADRQEYDLNRQIVTAEGNVLLRLDGGVVDADSLQVNLSNRIAVGQGNVAVTRGEQVLRGERFTYNFVQNTGDVQNARGEIFIPTLNQDFSPNLATDVSSGGVNARPPSDRITANQPIQGVTSTGGIGISVGAGRDINNVALPRQGGEVRRLRFQAEQVDFYPQGWQARNVRITNDPFSPAELELRADTVTLTRETPLRDRIRTTRQRLVFDQGFSIPIPRDQTVIDRSEREVNPGLFQVGLDGDERGGVFIERSFTPINTEQVQLKIAPQFFAQQAVLENGGNIIDPDLYGVRSRLRVNLGERTTLRGSAALTSVDLSKLEDNLRASLRLAQTIGTRLPHLLTLEYSYRDRLFNGSLGYQTVQSSLGGVLTSPVIPVGRTGIGLSYQAGAQLINAESDRLDLRDDDSDRISLSRLQGSVALSRGFNLWQGRGLEPTATQGLRYTPAPIVPYVQMFVGLKGVSSLYSSGDSQNTITGTVGIQGQFGHFSRRFLDYTGFNVSYSQDIRSGLSPFLFDRAVDNSVLDVGLVQQIYGPFRFGIQTSLNLNTGENISTDLILEYSRRTYGVAVRYNPILGLGALSLRISDFNWTGGGNLLIDSQVNPVVDGVRQINE